jgi:hypothetical protein
MPVAEGSAVGAARVVARVDRRNELALLPLADEEAGGVLAVTPVEECGNRLEQAVSG